MVHADAVAVIKRFEGLRLKPYLCPALVWTIGYGATYGSDGKRVTKSHSPITQEQADALLTRDLARFDRSVSKMVIVPISERQHGALVSFAFNLGSGALQASTLLKHINAMDWDDIPGQFMRWVNAGGRKLPGLVLRRQAEADLWLMG
jgi:lysozyme